MLDRGEAREGRAVLTARRRRSMALLCAVVLAACPAAAVTGVPRVPVEWRAVWSVPAETEFEPFLQAQGHAVSGQAVAVATREGGVRIHDARTGALRHALPADPAPVGGVWAAAGVLVVARQAAGERVLAGHDLATGALLWRRTITLADPEARTDEVGSYHGPRIMVTGRGVVVAERVTDPVRLQSLDLRTGTVTAQATRPGGCALTGAATARSVTLLSHCADDELRLSSIDARTLRQDWARPLPSTNSVKGAHPPLRIRANADGYVHATAGGDDFFCGPGGRLLSTGPQAVQVTHPGPRSPLLYAGPHPAAGRHGGAGLDGSWPLPAHLISVDPRTGRLGGLPIDLPADLVSLAGASGGLAFVHSTVPGGGRLTAYRLVHGPARLEIAWPDACALLTGRDLAAFAAGYRAARGPDGTATCDWIPPTDDGAVITLSVDWVAPSEAQAHRLYTAATAAVRRTGEIDPTTEAPGFLTYTVHRPNGLHGATTILAGRVIARLTSSSRQAVRIISPLLRDNLLARYRPGVRAPVPAPERGWSFPADAAIRTDPVVAGGVVHAADSGGTVSALDAATGAVRWRSRAGGADMDGHAVADGIVYVAGAGRVVALDAATGRPRWSRGTSASGDLVAANGRLHLWTRRPAWSATAALVTFGAGGERLWSFQPSGPMLNTDPVVTGDVVLAGSGHGVLYALAPATGAERWRFRAGGKTDRVQLVRSGATVYAVSTGGGVHAVDAGSGEARWSARVPGAVAFPPVVAAGTVYAGDDHGATYAFDAATGKRLWDFRAEGYQPLYRWTAAVASGLVFTAGPDRTLYALDAATGGVRRRLPLGKGHQSGPVAAHGLVHVADREGTLHTLDAATGAVRSAFRTGGTVETNPVVAGGFVYAGSSNGNVYARPTGDR
ncbi:PQQ-binding-like beta-propeller repeat protein [Nonomuraea thailandensis]|uniref:outer membrane protein assembly factor BamB family protein n=1 Tax=Nonomuraea thailandensis TaxID=1188745 RepID=UPI0020A3139F|nr:PQQ-binding-like beta-propeller repeat protein [Nonomuraea thailandensis]